MMLDLAKILKSKRAYRRQLAARPVAEKLAMLDALRERELAIRQPGRPAAESGALPFMKNPRAIVRMGKDQKAE